MITTRLVRNINPMRYSLIKKVTLRLAITVFCGLLPCIPTALAGSGKWHLSFGHSTVWQAMHSSYQLQGTTNPNILNKIAWFLKRSEYIKELVNNSQPYIYYIFQETQRRQMPAEIALMPMIESNYNPFLFSHTGATGLWQMMPGTASGFGIKINWWYDGRRSIIDSTKAALDYLNYLHNYFGDWLLAIAAYDSGEGTVANAIKHNKKLHRPTDFWSLPLPMETKTYVPKLLALAAIFKDPDHYHINLDATPNKPYFAAIDMNQQIDLNRVASLADTTVKTILTLNPGFRRWATLPNSRYQLLLPTDQAEIFKARFEGAKHSHITWIHHPVKPGESLSTIANRYHTNSTILRKINDLNSNIIKPNQELLVPVSYRGTSAIKTIIKQHGTIAEDSIPGPKGIEHNVVKGDTLWTIAARYGVTPNQIRYWNDLPYHASLSPSRQLIIWKQPHHTHVSHYRYKVIPNDSLSTIAHRFHVTISGIKQLNNINNNIVRVGHYILIPNRSIAHAHYTAKAKEQMLIHRVQAGESLSVIANYYRVPEKNIITWNKLNLKKPLRIGQGLRIYLSK